MARLLDYGFEPNGTIVGTPPNGFTSTTLFPAGGATITSDFLPPNSGNKAVKIVIPPSAAYTTALLDFDLVSNYTEVWARGYVNIDGILPALAVTGDLGYLIYMYSKAPNATSTASVRIIYNGTNLAWRLGTRNGTAYVAATDVPVTQSGWVCVELHIIAGTLGSADLYINGTRISQITGVNNATYPTNMVRFGCERPANATHTITAGIDDVAVDTGTVPIGPIQITPQPKLNVDSNLTGVPVTVDGIVVGTTPLVGYAVSPGNHTVSLPNEVTQ